MTMRACRNSGQFTEWSWWEWVSRTSVTSFGSSPRAARGLQERTQAERAYVDQAHPSVPAQQHHAAPAEAAVADRLPRITLDDDVDVVTTGLHVRSSSSDAPPRQAT